MRMGMMWNNEVATITESGWLDSFYKFSPNIFDAIKEVVWDTWFSGNVPYNMVLWTMKIEFIGTSCLTMFLIVKDKIPQGIRYLLIFFCGVYFAFLGEFPYLTMILGYILGSIFSNKSIKCPLYFQIVGIVLVILCAGYPSGYYPEYGMYAIDILPETIVREYMYCIGACVIVAICMLENNILHRLLSCDIFMKLGRVSLEVYVWQLPVLCTIISGLFYKANMLISKYAIVATLVILIGILLVYIVAEGMHYVTEKYWRPLCNKI